ncbi:hypothetical protein AMES_6753 [Amycolatopsis mediterranei S699]|uniref:Uncharacterized protein n=2 Tax=Amycolatopsis mediterranei TaxID=33910 RepID=A0A0H3DFY4_AMYMU|nr:DUF6235 family protein [Amycolatopsis mediterranei]ADJ48579.1 hypothetical protein AMED_6856 [Amycolatopsis mediterranei U32]AEK45509.1 hypothetical protein RAM_35180 [Amycolatopsis mediterranei S699]AFO80288.1 hypothetical protein AMES_6753 [Amycolatopsis mediterranei S699]AGT87416.1 hypothetical protein B737_6753 [Amycolatopsis mediterranei RB]KDO11188.1 hypothetical protein DV26_08655 [Amycolatopsis mediterranei]
MAVRLQLAAGVEVLERWAESAPQAERNIVYEALFAVGDGSAFLVYDIFGDPRDPGNFLVMVKPGLVLKIMVQRAQSAFEIRYVGAIDDDLGVRASQPEGAEPE